METEIRLTQYAHGAGCGCKISPLVLDEILKGNKSVPFPQLMVGNNTHDDAAVYCFNEDELLISTTDFFTPIVDDAYVFGKVAAANAISDVYAMGGKPVLALAILGWPVEKLPAALAGQVMEGARAICAEAGIPLAGGHSIDAAEPFFGLSVNGKVKHENLKRNNTAREGDLIFLTKPLGVGILSTAGKRGVLRDEDRSELYAWMSQLNQLGEQLGLLNEVTSMTDVTGFGIAGHLIEMAEGSGLSAELEYGKLPLIASLPHYLSQQVIPDATFRNWKAYHQKIQLSAGVDAMQTFQILPDPQTNGGLMFTVLPQAKNKIQELLIASKLEKFIQPIGKMVSSGDKRIFVNL